MLDRKKKKHDLVYRLSAVPAILHLRGITPRSLCRTVNLALTTTDAPLLEACGDPSPTLIEK